MKASWLYHLVQHESASMHYVPTNRQRADILTQGLSAYVHEEACEEL